MSQSTVAFFFMVAAFVIYITQRGELPTYLALVFGPAPQGNITVNFPRAGQTSDSSGTMQKVSEAAQLASLLG